ncbi:MAG: hypothetical protein JST54_10325 [Deltaproteobacteria bacterium]|nr:hypothetical protein [Deltaproteobacteria bacterium]
MIHALTLILLAAMPKTAHGFKVWRAAVDDSSETPRACAHMSKDLEICLEVHEADEDCSGTFSFKRRGAIAATWSGIGMMCSASSFEVAQVDLDGTGKPDLVVANLEASSNGLVVSWVALAVLDPRADSPLKALFHVQEFGWDAFLPRPNGAHFLASEWRGGTDSKGNSHTYLVGTELGWSNGCPRLLGSTERWRPLTNGLARDRAAIPRALFGAPRKLLSARPTEFRRASPADSKGAKEVVKVSGTPETTCFDFEDRSQVCTNAFARRGDGRLGAMLPMDLWCSDEASTLEGRRAAIAPEPWARRFASNLLWVW